MSYRNETPQQILLTCKLTSATVRAGYANTSLQNLTQLKMQVYCKCVVSFSLSLFFFLNFIWLFTSSLKCSLFPICCFHILAIYVVLMSPHFSSLLCFNDYLPIIISGKGKTFPTEINIPMLVLMLLV